MTLILALLFCLISTAALADGGATALALALFFTEATGEILTAGAFAALTTTVSVALAVGTTLAIQAGSSLLQQALGGNGTNAGGGVAGSGVANASASLRSTSRIGILNREMILGTVLKAGNLFFEQVRGPYLYRGFIIAPHIIDGIPQFQIGTTTVTVDSNGVPVQQPYKTAAYQYLALSTRLGNPDQAIDPIIAKDFASLDRGFRQRGIATAVVKYYRGVDSATATSVWGQSDPQPLFLVRGKRFYDPRDSSQSIADKTTWKWTANAALITAGWLNDADGQNVSWNDISIPYLTVAANVCDQKVRRKDGTFEPRYEINGVVDTASDPSATFQNLMLSMMGEYTIIDGQYALIAGAPRDAVRTLTESSARGPLDVGMDRPWTDVINTVRTSFVAKDRAYAVSSGPVYQDAAALAIDGAVKSVTLDLNFVNSQTQVQRIAKNLIQRSRLGRSIQRDEDIEAWRLTPTDVVSVVYSGGLAPVNGLYEIMRITDGQRSDEFTLQLLQYDPVLLFGWNPAVDERDWSQATINVS